jgi:hypothetical protein
MHVRQRIERIRELGYPSKVPLGLARVGNEYRQHVNSVRNIELPAAAYFGVKLARPGFDPPGEKNEGLTRV